MCCVSIHSDLSNLPILGKWAEEKFLRKRNGAPWWDKLGWSVSCLCQLCRRVRIQICTWTSILGLLSALITKAEEPEGLGSSAGGRRQPVHSEIRASIWSTLRTRSAQVSPDQQPSPDHLRATHFLLQTVTKCSVVFGFFESPQRDFRPCRVHAFSFLAFRGWTEESSKDFLLGRNPPSQRHRNVSAPLLVSSYKNLASRTQGLACVST